MIDTGDGDPTRGHARMVWPSRPRGLGGVCGWAASALLCGALVPLAACGYADDDDPLWPRPIHEEANRDALVERSGVVAGGASVDGYLEHNCDFGSGGIDWVVFDVHVGEDQAADDVVGALVDAAESSGWVRQEPLSPGQEVVVLSKPLGDDTASLGVEAIDPTTIGVRYSHRGPDC